MGTPKKPGIESNPRKKKPSKKDVSICWSLLKSIFAIETEGQATPRCLEEDKGLISFPRNQASINTNQTSIKHQTSTNITITITIIVTTIIKLQRTSSLRHFVHVLVSGIFTFQGLLEIAVRQLHLQRFSCEVCYRKIQCLRQSLTELGSKGHMGYTCWYIIIMVYIYISGI